jgi:hypothetical protein
VSKIEDGGSKVLQNVSNLAHHYTTLQLEDTGS